GARAARLLPRIHGAHAGRGQSRGTAHRVRRRRSRARRVLLFRRSLSLVSPHPAMKVPDLDQFDDAGVREWHGSIEPLAAAAKAAGAHCHAADLKSIAGKSDLMRALQRALALPEHFGENWDA